MTQERSGMDTIRAIKEKATEKNNELLENTNRQLDTKESVETRKREALTLIGISVINIQNITYLKK